MVHRERRSPSVLLNHSDAIFREQSVPLATSMELRADACGGSRRTCERLLKSNAACESGHCEFAGVTRFQNSLNSMLSKNANAFTILSSRKVRNHA
jgi:hypothetical protein